MMINCVNCGEALEVGRFLGVELFFNPPLVGIKVNMAHQKCEESDLFPEEQIERNTVRLKANQVLTAPIKE